MALKLRLALEVSSVRLLDIADDEAGLAAAEAVVEARDRHAVLECWEHRAAEDVQSAGTEWSEWSKGSALYHGEFFALCRLSCLEVSGIGTGSQHF